MTVTTSREPPSERAVEAMLDDQAQAAARRAGRRMGPIVSREAPRGRTGKVARELRPRVSRSGSGHRLTVRAKRGVAHGRYSSVAQVVKYLTSGTGVYREGPGPKSPIRPKRRYDPRAALILPGGRRVRKVKGQRPNDFIARIERQGTPLVDDEFKRSAREALRAIDGMT